jgi:hypothetical protein
VRLTTGTWPVPRFRAEGRKAGSFEVKNVGIISGSLDLQALMQDFKLNLSSNYYQFTTFEKISCERKERVLICPRNPASRHNYHTIPYNVRRDNAV